MERAWKVARAIERFFRRKKVARRATVSNRKRVTALSVFDVWRGVSLK